MSTSRSLKLSSKARCSRHCAVRTARTHREQRYRCFVDEDDHSNAASGSHTFCIPEFVVSRAMRAMLWVIAARDQKTSRISLLTFLLSRRAAQDERARFVNASHTSQAQRRLRCAVRSVARWVRRT